jgi:hypothetical protein
MNKLYAIKGVGYLIEELLISSRWYILVLSVTDEINQGVIIEIQASCSIYTDNRTESEMREIPGKFPGTAVGIV